MAEMDMSEGSEQGEDAAQGGFTVCLTVGADGKMTVGVEPEKAPGEEGEAPGQPVPSARDAISMIMDIIKAGGKMPDSSGDDEFNKGFGKPQGGPMLDKMKFDGDDQ